MKKIYDLLHIVCNFYFDLKVYFSIFLVLELERGDRNLFENDEKKESDWLTLILTMKKSWNWWQMSPSNESSFIVFQKFTRKYMTNYTLLIIFIFF